MDFEWTAGVGRKDKWRPTPLSLPPPLADLCRRLPPYHHRCWASPPMSLKCFPSHRSSKKREMKRKKRQKLTQHKAVAIV